MAATVKYDDGTGSFVNNCFPVRSIIKYIEPGEGAWLEAHRAEQRKQFKAVVCAKPPRTYSRLRHERMVGQEEAAVETAKAPTLDGFFLMKHSCVDDPADLCSMNISGLEFSEARPEDFLLFDNVAYINAADNFLNLDVFSNFSILRELELPVNEISSFNLSHKLFPHLEMLDLSYNHLNSDGVLQLGYLRNLKVLYLSGNNLNSLPENLAGYYLTKTGCKKRRFPNLEILCLDDNQLNNYTAFAPLAGLKQLKHLNLESNEISAVPQLESKIIKHDTAGKSDGAENPDSRKVQLDNADKLAPPGDEVAEGTAKTTDPLDLVDESVVDFDFGELELPDISSLDVTNLTGADGGARLGSDGQELTDSEDEVEEESDPAIPFPQLRFLTIAHNYLSEEEDLLPIAAWPNITQVHIYDNPLTNDRSGDPPMLKKFLTDRLGIDLIRKKPAVMRPAKEFPPPPKNRSFSSIVPPVPKCDANKLISLEYYKPLPTTPAAKSPLPPLDKTPAVPVDTDTAAVHRVDASLSDAPAAEATAHSPPDIMAEDILDEMASRNKSDDHGGMFFMTQVDEPTASAAPVAPAAPAQYQPDEMKIKRKVIAIPPEQQDMFIGYEELLIEDEYEKDIHVPGDLHNTVKALSYALKHPVVNNYTMRLESSQKPFFSYKRSDVRSRKRPQTKAEKINHAMVGVRAMNTVIESPLDRALTDKSITKKYPEAAKLLREIQTKYSRAHSSTLGETESLRAVLNKDTLSRPQTDIVRMVDKDSSVTDLIRPNTNL